MHLLNVHNDGDRQVSLGSRFHSQGATTKKALSGHHQSGMMGQGEGLPQMILMAMKEYSGEEVPSDTLVPVCKGLWAKPEP